MRPQNLTDRALPDSSPPVSLSPHRFPNRILAPKSDLQAQLQSAVGDPNHRTIALKRLAELYEARGDRDKAVELQPQVEDVRGDLEVGGGVISGTRVCNISGYPAVCLQ